MAELEPLFSFQLLGGKLVFAADEFVGGYDPSPEGELEGGDEYSDEMAEPPTTAHSDYLKDYLGGDADDLPDDAGPEEGNDSAGIDPNDYVEQSEKLGAVKEDEDFNRAEDEDSDKEVALFFGGEDSDSDENPFDDDDLEQIEEELGDTVFGGEEIKEEDIAAFIGGDTNIVPENYEGPDKPNEDFCGGDTDDELDAIFGSGQKKDRGNPYDYADRQAELTLEGAADDDPNEIEGAIYFDH